MATASNDPNGKDAEFHSEETLTTDPSGPGPLPDLAPIVLFVYNRPGHTRQTLMSLMANELSGRSELFIFADGPKENASDDDMAEIREVRELIKERQWCRTVHITGSGSNKGLADSIIVGVTEVVNRFGKVIVLEDDMILSNTFLTYMNEALTLYRDEEKVFHVSGYMYPVQGRLPKTFFVNLATCWGWGTWKRAWKYFETDSSKLLDKINTTGSKSRFNLEDSYDWHSHLAANAEGRMKTWAIRWYASFYLMNGYCLHPNVSLVRNIGNDSSGMNCGQDDILLNQKIGDIGPICKVPIKESLKARRLVKTFFIGYQQGVVKKESSLLKKTIDLFRL